MAHSAISAQPSVALQVSDASAHWLVAACSTQAWQSRGLDPVDVSLRPVVIDVSVFGLPPVFVLGAPPVVVALPPPPSWPPPAGSGRGQSNPQAAIMTATSAKEETATARTQTMVPEPSLAK